MATQSDANTVEIAESIEDIQTAIRDVVKVMSHAPKAIEEGREMVQKTVQALSKIMNSTENTATQLGIIKDNTHEQIEHTKEVVVSISNITDNSKVSVNESENILERVKQQEMIVSEIAGAASDLAKLGEELITVSASFKI